MDLGGLHVSWCATGSVGLARGRSFRRWYRHRNFRGAFWHRWGRNHRAGAVRGVPKSSACRRTCACSCASGRRWPSSFRPPSARILPIVPAALSLRASCGPGLCRPLSVSLSERSLQPMRQPEVFKLAFVLIAGAIAAKLLFGRANWVVATSLPGAVAMTTYGFLVGLASSLMGVSGGSLSTIVLTFYGQPIHSAVATSAGHRRPNHGCRNDRLCPRRIVSRSLIAPPFHRLRLDDRCCGHGADLEPCCPVWGSARTCFAQTPARDSVWAVSPCRCDAFPRELGHARVALSAMKTT